MRKLIYILIGLFALGSYAQGGPKVDVIKFRGEVTTTVRNTFDVPTGETWLIWNETEDRMERAQSDDVWKSVVTSGTNNMSDGITLRQSALNSIEIMPDGAVGGTDFIRMKGGETPNEVYLYLTSNYATIENYSIADIEAVGDASLTTKEYVDSVSGGGTIDAAITDGSANAVENNAIFDALVLKGGLSESNTWTGLNTFSNTVSAGTIISSYDIQPRGLRLTTPGTVDIWRQVIENTDDPDLLFYMYDGGLGGTIDAGYKLNASGTPTDATDLTDKAYVDSVVGGGSTDDQTASEVPVTASGFDGNLDTGDDTVQKVAQKLDDLVVDTGGGIVAEGSVDVTTLTAVAVAGGANTATVTITHSLGYVPSASRIYTQLSRPDEQSTYSNTGAVGNITSTTFDFLMSGTSGHDLQLNWAIFGVGSETPLDFGEIATGLDTEIGDTDWRTGGSGIPSDITGLTGAGAITNIVTGTLANIASWSSDAGRLSIPTDAVDYKYIQIALSDLTTNITTGTSKGYFRMPYAATLSGVSVSLLTAGTSTGLTVDVNESGTTVLSTKLTTDATEKTSATAATAAVISDTSLAADAEMTFDFDAVPTGGKGVIVTLKIIEL